MVSLKQLIQFRFGPHPRLGFGLGFGLGLGRRAWRLLGATLALGLVLSLGSCAPTDHGDINHLAGKDAVMPISLGERAFVRPDAMAKGLVEAGLSADQALTFGPYLMEMIAAEGGAELHLSGRLIFAVAVFGDDLFITSMEQGLTLVRGAV